jgi:GNAT superfamily N-acetyltransferase
MTVRLATQKDEAQLMDLCHALHADNGIFTMDDELVRAMLYRAFDKKGGIVGVLDGTNELAAAIYMTFSKFWYSHDTHLEELFNFVRPTYRKSDCARRLLDFAKDCQKTLGLPLITGIVTNKRTEAKVLLYRKKLGPPAGAFFVVGAHWANETVKPCDDLWVRHSHGRDNKKRIIDAVLPSTMTTLPLPMMPMTNGGG